MLDSIFFLSILCMYVSLFLPWTRRVFFSLSSEVNSRWKKKSVLNLQCNLGGWCSPTEMSSRTPKSGIYLWRFLWEIADRTQMKDSQQAMGHLFLKQPFSVWCAVWALIIVFSQISPFITENKGIQNLLLSIGWSFQICLCYKTNIWHRIFD